MFVTKFVKLLKELFRGYNHEFSVGYVLDKIRRPVKTLRVTSEIVAPLHPKRTVSCL